MGLLKSVIADARPAKSLGRIHSGPATVSGQIPAPLSSGGATAQSSDGQTNGLLRSRTQPESLVSDARHQDASRQSSALSNTRDDHSLPGQTRPHQAKIKHPDSQVSEKSGRQTMAHSEEPDKPVSRTVPLQRGGDLPLTKPALPGLPAKPGGISTGSLDSSGPGSKPIEKNTHADPDRGFTKEKVTSANAGNFSQDRPVTQPISAQDPVPAMSGEPSPDTTDRGFSSLPVEHEESTASDANDGRLEPGIHADKTHDKVGYVEPGENLHATGSRRANTHQGHEAGLSTENVKPDTQTSRYPNIGRTDAHQNERNPIAQVTANTEPEWRSAEDQLSAVGTRLNHLDSQVERRENEQAGLEVMAAQTTSMIADRLASQQAEWQASTNPVEVNQVSAEVRIGQVDVFIEKPVASSEPARRSTRPSISLASRRYLRRL